MAKGPKAPLKGTGSYTIEFQSGKKYIGKGPKSRMNQSAARIERHYGDKAVKKDWSRSLNDREAFKDEYRRMLKENVTDPKSDSSVYNQRQSPGKKYIERDGF